MAGFAFAFPLSLSTPLARLNYTRNLPMVSLVFLYMIRYYSFRLFVLCLLSCTSLVLGVIWLQEKIQVPAYFQTTATLFAIGLASFLIWFTLTLTEIRNHF